MTPDPDPAALVAAVDRLTQVVDHHAARLYDQAQRVADTLGDILDHLEHPEGVRS